MKVAVLAAGGHTGRFVVEALRARGAEPVPLTRSGVDARDKASVAKAIGGADALVNLAGPFLKNGLAPVEAAIEAGVPYVDTTGEQAFMFRVREELGDTARRGGVAVVNALAWEYALGDLAAKLHFPEGGDALHVLYRSPGAGGSAGTKKSVLRVMAGRTLSYEDGKLESVGAARYQRTFATADGKRSSVSFAGGEVLTVPTHTPFRTVRTYVATRRPGQAKLFAPAARLLLHGPVLSLAERVVDARHRAPRNERARGAVHLVAEPSGKHVVVRSGDPYVLTGEIAAEGAVRLAKAAKAGVLAPAVAFDPAEFFEALRKRLPDFGVETVSPIS